MQLRALGLLAASFALLAGCSMGSAIPAQQLSAPISTGPQPSPARPVSELPLAAGTCWTGELLGSDPQLALQLAGTFGITYFDAAYAIKDRPSFLERRDCRADHAVEVYRLVPASALSQQVSDYGTLMRKNTVEYTQLSAAVARACMDRTLTVAAGRSGIGLASLQPALPDGYSIRWAPATLEQWNRGQRVFACLLVQDEPSPLRYAALRSPDLPTELRTCIASGPRIFVDCARKHDRERIALLDVSGAVAAGTFPVRYQDQGAAFYRPLDRACTTYLHAVSTSRRLVGVAEIDRADWPGRDGAYRVSCEADAPPTKASVVTQGSVYNRR